MAGADPAEAVIKPARARWRLASSRRPRLERRRTARARVEAAVAAEVAMAAGAAGAVAGAAVAAVAAARRTSQSRW